jgi:hypothetical protein
MTPEGLDRFDYFTLSVAVLPSTCVSLYSPAEKARHSIEFSGDSSAAQGSAPTAAVRLCAVLGLSDDSLAHYEASCGIEGSGRGLWLPERGSRGAWRTCAPACLSVNSCSSESVVGPAEAPADGPEQFDGHRIHRAAEPAPKGSRSRFAQGPRRGQSRLTLRRGSRRPRSRGDEKHGFQVRKS